MNNLISQAPAPVAANGGMGTPAPIEAPQMPPGAMQGPPGGMPPGPPQPPPTPEQLKTARTHIGAIVNGLRDLVNKPRGDLTKKDVFDAAADMISKGAFPTPESKQDLIVHLANLPDDERGLRTAIGGLLLQTGGVQDAIHQMHGPG